MKREAEESGKRAQELLRLSHETTERRKLAQEAAETASEEEVIEVKKKDVMECILTLKTLRDATRKAADFLSNAERAFRARETLLSNSQGYCERILLKRNK